MSVIELGLNFLRLKSNQNSYFVKMICLQCFDTVGQAILASERVSGL